MSSRKLYGASGKGQLNLYLASNSVYLCNGKQDRCGDSVRKLWDCLCAREARKWLIHSFHSHLNNKFPLRSAATCCYLVTFYKTLNDEQNENYVHVKTLNGRLSVPWNYSWLPKTSSIITEIISDTNSAFKRSSLMHQLVICTLLLYMQGSTTTINFKSFRYPILGFPFLMVN